MDDILNLLPTCLGQSSDTQKLQAVSARMRDIGKQALLLSIREWYAKFPWMNKSFQVDKQEDGEYHFRAMQGLMPNERVALTDLINCLEAHTGSNNNELITSTLTFLNVVRWDRTRAEGVLRKMADRYTTVGADVLFTMADQAKLDQDTPHSEHQGRSPRL